MISSKPEKYLLDDVDIQEEKSHQPRTSSSSSHRKSLVPRESLIGSLPENEEGHSEIMGIFLLLNSMIGSGILNQPAVFESSGIIAALIMFTVAAWFTWYALNILIECGIQTEKYDFSQLSYFLFGEFGEKVVDISIVIGNFGALISYLDVIGGTASDLFYSWGCTSSAGCSAYVATPIFIVIYILPVCSLRYFGHLSWYSVFSMAAIISCLGLVVIGGPIVGSGGVITLFSRGAGTGLGSIVFTLNCSFAAFHTFKSMKNPSLEKWKRVTAITVLLGYFLCCAMGIAGYLSFGTETQGVILTNFTGHYADFFKVLLILHLVLYIPVEFLIMRHSIVKMMGIKTGSIPSYLWHMVLTVFLLFAGGLVILLLRYAGYSQGNSFSLVLDFTGAISGSLISFILPGMFYLQINGSAWTTSSLSKNHKILVNSYICVAMVAFGTAILFAVPVLSVLSVV